MGALHVATLLVVGGFYGVFIGLIVAGSFDPANICGAYDAPHSPHMISDCRAAFDLVFKHGANGALAVHVITMVMRLEGFLWAGLGLAALPAIFATSLRPGVFMVGALSLSFASLTHAHHIGLLGPAPWHAIHHTFNTTLMVTDGVTGMMCIASLLTSSAGKAKTA
mmetsp:Transcript_56741/g.93871  ORF Transcript_56741/g.93871 Transcript_56741/m.93871 type:complete len:166 (+) Transcript_56741:37-534(+)